jgi:hypothetical protein
MKHIAIFSAAHGSVQMCVRAPMSERFMTRQGDVCPGNAVFSGAGGVGGAMATRIGKLSRKVGPDHPIDLLD